MPPRRRCTTTRHTPPATSACRSRASPAPTGENAAALAKAHSRYHAALPPLTAGDLVKVHMALKDMVVEIAPGVKYTAWAFDGPARRARSSTCGRARRSR